MTPFARATSTFASLILLAAGCVEPTEPRGTERDREFEDGSRVATQPLSETQVDNLVILGKVWGFAKYHHPAVTLGNINWDYELFRILPQVLDAPDHAAANAAIATWLAKFDPIEECSACATPDADVHLAPDIGWIADVPMLGAELAERLETIHRNRSRLGVQRYVSLAQGVGNPLFSEASYGGMRQPDAGYRVLALFRFWNIIEYWFPYRDVIDEDWDAVLREFVPRMLAQALSGEEYRLQLIQLITRIQDTHAGIFSLELLEVQPPGGLEDLMTYVTFLDGQAVVTGFRYQSYATQAGLRIGDVIESVDGQPVASLVEAWRSSYPASNEAALLRDIGRNLLRGRGLAQVEGSRADGTFSISTLRTPYSAAVGFTPQRHDVIGSAFQTPFEDVAYITLARVVAAEVPQYIEQAQGARLLILDLRGGLNAFVPFVLGGHLVTAPTPFVRFTAGSLTNPGTMRWGSTLSITPRTPHFSGPVAILVDELVQSSGEYHAMAFRAAPNAFVVGSTTAGADGNISRVAMPGGYELIITGLGVFYPDGGPTQRLGIVPDIFVQPTLAGIRSGRDEVLEAAVNHVLGARD